jgi:CysZ protein
MTDRLLWITLAPRPASSKNCGETKVAASIQDGVSAAVGGIRFVAGTPALWPWALVPAGFLLVLSCGLGGLAVWAAGEASTAIAGAGRAGQAGGWAVYIGLVRVGLFVAVLLALMLAQPLSGFALERIAVAQERALGVTRAADAGFVAASYAGLKAALATLLVAILVLLPLFVVDVVFPPAVIVTLPLKFVLGGWLLAWDFADYSLSRRGLGLRGRLRWAAGCGPAFTAFGLVWAVLLLVPGIYLLALPLGVAGAARLVCAREPAGANEGL